MARGRRPAAEVRNEVLDAAGELLLDGGMGPFTFESVSAASGASRTTLHKWWPSKGALALEAYFHAVEQQLAFPDTGDIATDLTTQLRAFARLVGTTRAGQVIGELIGQAQSDPDLSAAFRANYSRPRRDLAIEAVARAQGRGQVREDVDPEIVVDQLWGACYHRLLIPDLPVTEEFAVALVDTLVRGLRPVSTNPSVDTD